MKFFITPEPGQKQGSFFHYQEQVLDYQHLKDVTIVILSSNMGKINVATYHACIFAYQPYIIP